MTDSIIRQAALIFLLSTVSLIGQTATLQTTAGAPAPEPTSNIVTAPASSAKRLPLYLVYRYFLAWTNQLENAATTSGSTDPYSFAKAFKHAGLQHPELDLIRDEAHRLQADLQQHQAKAQAIIDRYRRDGERSLAQGNALPPAPPEVPQLERERTSILVQHYVALRSALGRDAAAQLDAYLEREFVPHLSLKPLGKPAASIALASPTQPFTLR